MKQETEMKLAELAQTPTEELEMDVSDRTTHSFLPAIELVNRHLAGRNFEGAVLALTELSLSTAYHETQTHIEGIPLLDAREILSAAFERVRAAAPPEIDPQTNIMWTQIVQQLPHDLEDLTSTQQEIEGGTWLSQEGPKF